MSSGVHIEAAVRLDIAHEADLSKARALVRDFAMQAQLNTSEQTRLITAVSELVRNLVKYAGSRGELHAELLAEYGLDFGRTRRGVRARVSDTGPGIADLDLAMRDGYSSGGSLGVGLPGTKRLVDEFEIQSALGVGTTVTIVKWTTSR